MVVRLPRIRRTNTNGCITRAIGVQGPASDPDQDRGHDQRCGQSQTAPSIARHDGRGASRALALPPFDYG